LFHEIKNTFNQEKYIPNYVPNKSKGTYELNLEMDLMGRFNVSAIIKVENLSENIWDKIVFYFIPNVFTEENKDKLGKNNVKEYANVEIETIKVNGLEPNYTLNYDTLILNLVEKMNEGEERTVEISYNFTVPEHGIRFVKKQDNYYLAQWYPMLATYRDGWNKEEYLPLPEPYHTGHSNFTINYKIPKGYTLVSSSEQDSRRELASGKLEVTNVKEVFIGILKNPKFISETVEGIEVRVFGLQEDYLTDALKISLEALSFYKNVIGPYPYRQLDIIFGKDSMEYPGIVTIGVRTNLLEYVIVHEIGHQWFYGVVSCDPYFHAWLKEGITEIATSLFLYEYRQKSIEESFIITDRVSRINSNEKKVSNLPISYYQNEVLPYLYDQPTIKLWKLFDDFGGVEVVKQFLHDYYEKYSFKEIDTEEFVRFTKDYFKLEDNKYFEDWLNLN